MSLRLLRLAISIWDGTWSLVESTSIADCSGSSRNKMVDVFAKKKRSAIMSAIKGRGTRSTEVATRRLLKKHKIKGWRTHGAGMPGTPDFVFKDIKLVLFVDGCFWHGCKICMRNRTPATHAKFWREKLSGNMRRDRRVNRRLNRMGWSVLRIWEHSIEKNGEQVVTRIIRTISAKREGLRG